MKKLKIYTLLTLAIAMSGCTADNENVDSFATDGFVRFNVKVDNKSMTKSSIVTPENQTSTFKKFGVWALNIADGDYFMENERINYDSNTSSWVSVNPVADWPSGGLQFYGYTPLMNPNVASSINSDGDMVIDFKNEELAGDQVDLMVTDPVAMSTEACVDMTFNHALAALAFKFTGDGVTAVKSVGFQGVYSGGELVSTSEGERRWDNLTLDTKRTFRQVLTSNNVPKEGSPLTTSSNGEYLMMIPIEKEKFADMDIVVTLENIVTGAQNVVAFDMPTDMSWEASNIYTYTMDIINMDVINFDVVVNPWVDDLGDLESSTEPELGALELSNCYMYNSDLADRVIYIPVDERIKEFYKGYLGYTGDLLRKHTLQVGEVFTPIIIWYVGDDSFEACIDEFKFEQMPQSELEVIPRNDRVMPTCTNNFLTSTCRAAMKITIPAAAKEGSVLIGLTKEIDGKSTLLWSWHLWVTEYDPNSKEPIATGTEGVYTVTKGEVHRYKDSGAQTPAVWGAGGIYGDCYIMDRNIGARGVNRKYGENDVFYYQFGRKDPMPAKGQYTTYLNGYAYKEGYMDGAYNDGISKGMLEAVRNPTISWVHNFDNGSPSWTEDEAAFDVNATWNDVRARHDLYANKYTVQKSIFDPSPLGWKIPVGAVWSDFLKNKDVYRITEANKGMDVPEGYDFSFNFWPLKDDSEGMLFNFRNFVDFTDTGYGAHNQGFYGRESGSSFTTYYGFYSALWSCTNYHINGYNYNSGTTRPVPSDAYNLRIVFTDESHYATYATSDRNCSMSIRCIQEQY